MRHGGDARMRQRRSRIVVALSLGATVLATTGLFVSCGGEAPDGVQESSREDDRPVELEAPGVRETGPNQYEVVIHSYDGGFLPAEIRVPVGAEVTFRGTSRDIPHGFLIEDTDVELELYSGTFTEARHTFTDPGEHLFRCHTYCGGDHDFMRGTVIVDARD